jgi:hypothetical protein
VWCTAETCTGVAAETRAHAHLNGHLGSIWIARGQNNFHFTKYQDMNYFIPQKSIFVIFHNFSPNLIDALPLL